METLYSETDYTDVSSKNDVWVNQTGTQQYMLHQFKDFVGANVTCQLEWEGKTTLTPSSSTVYLQIYNLSGTPQWDTVDSDNTSNADTDFSLLAQIEDLTNYKSNGVISCRVYQNTI